MHFWLAMKGFAKKIRNLNMQWWMWLLSISKTLALCQADDDPGTLYPNILFDFTRGNFGHDPVVASTSCSMNTVKLVAVCKKLKFCMTFKILHITTEVHFSTGFQF
jgi:hypothetical protein